MLTRDSPLRIAVLCSHRAPGLAHVLDDPRCGRLYGIVACLTTEGAFEGQREAESAGIPCLAHPLRRFCASRRVRLVDLGARVEYDARSVALLAPFRPDVVVLSSYLFVLTEPMLAAYGGRIVNVHHSDLTILNGGGRPRYVGLRSVRDAILAGEPETRATAHLVTDELDAGPPLLRSWSFPVAPVAAEALAWGARDMLKAYAFAHQEWMLRGAWGPLIVATLETLATRRVRTAGRSAWLDGVPGPWDLLADGTTRPRGEAVAALEG